MSDQDDRLSQASDIESDDSESQRMHDGNYEPASIAPRKRRSTARAKPRKTRRTATRNRITTETAESESAPMESLFLRLLSADPDSDSGLAELFVSELVEHNATQGSAAVANLINMMLAISGISTPFSLASDIEGTILTYENNLPSFISMNRPWTKGHGQLDAAQLRKTIPHLFRQITRLCWNHSAAGWNRFLNKVLEWFVVFSDVSTVREIRQPMTVACLSSIGEIYRIVFTESRLTQNDDEEEELPSNSRTDELSNAAEDLFSRVFVVRTLDEFAAIRRECIAALAEWMNNCPPIVNDANLSYLTDRMRDVDKTVRMAAFHSYQRVLKSAKDNKDLVTYFLSESADDVLEVAQHDKESSLRRQALITLLPPVELTDGQLRKIFRLLYDPDAKVREAACRHLIAEVNKELESFNVDRLLQFNEKARAWLIFSVIAQHLSALEASCVSTEGELFSKRLPIFELFEDAHGFSRTSLVCQSMHSLLQPELDVSWTDLLDFMKNVVFDIEGSLEGLRPLSLRHSIENVIESAQLGTLFTMLLGFVAAASNEEQTVIERSSKSTGAATTKITNEAASAYFSNFFSLLQLCDSANDEHLMATCIQTLTILPFDQLGDDSGERFEAAFDSIVRKFGERNSYDLLSACGKLFAKVANDPLRQDFAMSQLESIVDTLTNDIDDDDNLGKLNAMAYSTSLKALDDNDNIIPNLCSRLESGLKDGSGPSNSKDEMQFSIISLLKQFCCWKFAIAIENSELGQTTSTQMVIETFEKLIEVHEKDRSEQTTSVITYLELAYMEVRVALRLVQSQLKEPKTSVPAKLQQLFLQRIEEKREKYLGSPNNQQLHADYDLCAYAYTVKLVILAGLFDDASKDEVLEELTKHTSDLSESYKKIIVSQVEQLV